MVRVLITGSRDWWDYDFIFTAIRALHTRTPISLVIEGEARGADRIGRTVAQELGIPVATYPAKWDDHGIYKPNAGLLRNQQMLDDGKPDLVLAFHDDLAHSRGTADMVRRARIAGVPVQLYKHEAQ